MDGWGRETVKIEAVRENDKREGRDEAMGLSGENKEQEGT